MAESNSKTETRLFVLVVVYLIFLSLVTLTLAVCLPLFADTTLLVQTADGVIVERPAYVSSTIEKLWQAFFSSMSALIGLLGGKVL